MRRFARIRVQYLAAVALAVAIGGGIYALRGSQTKASVPATSPVLSALPRTSPAPTVASVPGTPTAPPVTRPPRARRQPTHPRNPVPSAAALLARVRSAYVHVPGVVVNGTLVKARLRMTFVLHDDKIVANGWLGTGANGEVIGAVTPPRSPTFARELGTDCWQSLPKSNVLSPADIGTPFPPTVGSTFGTPVPARGGWAITGESDGALTTFVIDAGTFQLRSMTSSQNGLSFSGNAVALSSAPALPVPEPRC